MKNKLPEKTYQLLNVIATDKSNEVGGAAPKTIEQAGTPWIDFVGWSKQLDWPVKDTEFLFKVLINAWYFVKTIPDKDNLEAYCYLTNKGFKAWLEETKNRTSSRKYEGNMVDESTEERTETMAKKVENKKAAAKKAPAKKAPAKKAATKKAPAKKEAKTKKAKEPKEPKPKMEKKNGITHPRPGTICDGVWMAFDSAAKSVDKSSRKEMTKLVMENTDYDKGTIGVQFRQWAIFNGCYKKLRG